VDGQLGISDIGPTQQQLRRQAGLNGWETQRTQRSTFDIERPRRAADENRQ
jgi:hypothetical protein